MSRHDRVCLFLLPDSPPRRKTILYILWIICALCLALGLGLAAVPLRAAELTGQARDPQRKLAETTWAPYPAAGLLPGAAQFARRPFHGHELRPSAAGRAHQTPSAQTATTAEIRGTVTAKSTGTAIAGVRVLVKNEALKVQRETQAGVDGRFAISALPAPAEYQISIRADGFRPLTRDKVALLPGDALTMDFALELSVVYESVTVHGVADRVITGSKTDAPLKDIPASIQVVPKELLADQGAYSLDGILKNVSGATQGSGSNYGFFNLYQVRGLEQKFLRDGIPDGPSINGYARTLTDVERVEVLKGPASALYGSGQPGGVVNLISKEPLETRLYSLYQTFGSFGAYRTAVDFGGRIGTEKLLYRLNAAYYTSDGFRDLSNTTTEVLPTLTWRPNKSHTLTLDFNYRKLDVVADSAGVPFRGGSILSVSLDTKFYTPFSGTNQKVFRGAMNSHLRLTDNLLLRNNFVVLRRDLFLARNSGGRVAEGSVALTGRRFREETNFATDVVYQLEPVWSVKTATIKHTLLGGFEYQRQLLAAKRAQANLPNIANVFRAVIPETSRASLVFTPTFDRDIETNQFSLYAQDQIEFSEQWKARAGVRFAQFDSQDLERIQSTRRSRSDNKIDANLGLVYQPLKSTSFYAAFSRGHHATLSNEGAALAPETATQWELGNKSTFLHDRITANLALFRVTREDFLSGFPDQVPIGEQRTRGVELDLASELLSGWKLSGNYAFADAVLVRLTDRLSVGKRPTGVPRHSAAFWTTYELRRGRLRGLGFGGGLTFKVGIFNDDRNTQKIPSFEVGDLVFLYRRGRFRGQVNINNFTSTHFFRNGLFGTATPGEPRTVQGTLQMRF